MGQLTTDLAASQQTLENFPVGHIDSTGNILNQTVNQSVQNLYATNLQNQLLQNATNNQSILSNNLLNSQNLQTLATKSEFSGTLDQNNATNENNVDASGDQNNNNNNNNNNGSNENSGQIEAVTTYNN